MSRRKRRTSIPVPLQRRKSRTSLVDAVRAVAAEAAPVPVPRDARLRPASVHVARAQFARSRLARASLVTLATVLLAAIFADVLAADLPIACRVHDSVYLVPNIVRPPELAGRTNTTLSEARGPGDLFVFPLVRRGPLEESPEVLVAPSLRHPFGTDARGRDVFARVVHGARVTLAFGLATALLFVAFGAFVGALAGFFGGAFDTLVTRVVEILAALPTLVLVLVVQAILRREVVDGGGAASPFTMLLTIAATRWTEVARIVRAEVIFASSQDYTLAARALGASPWRVFWKHVLPNALVPALAAAPFGVAAVLLIEAAMDFLGVGLAASAPSWGETLGEARFRPGAWWLLGFPGVVLFLTLVALNLVGEALRDALDPRLRDEEGHLGRAVGG